MLIVKGCACACAYTYEMQVLDAISLPFLECKKCHSFGIDKQNPDAPCKICKHSKNKPIQKSHTRTIKKSHSTHSSDMSNISEECIEDKEIPLFVQDGSVVQSTTLLSCDTETVDRSTQLKGLHYYQENSVHEILHSFSVTLNPIDPETYPVRRGYLIGDGTGTGKGRIISSIIHVESNKGFKKHIWVSSSPDLIHDAFRDLSDVGYYDNGLRSKPLQITDTKQTHSISHNGIVFMTYSALISKKRMDQIMKWCNGSDFEGVIVFDESHKGKHSMGSNASQTSSAMIKLQNTLYKSKVVYASATACSRPKHMGYMTRLGLWGYEKSPFKSFEEFQRSLRHMTSLSNEIIAIHLKRKGVLCSRHMSFNDVTFNKRIIDIDSEDIQLYNTACTVFQDIYAIKEVRESSHKMHHWSAVLRFFRALMVSFKMDELFRLIDAHTPDKSIIISIQSTFEEYSTHRSEDFDAPHAILNKYVKMVHTYSEDARSKVTAIMNGVSHVQFGKGNPLDMLLERYTHSRIAEITGRNTGISNMDEQTAFINGKKDIAIISEASSHGISLHSNHAFRNQKKRFHIILEIPWSVEQFMQQCGRSHRTGQVNAPHYELLVTQIPSENRFVSSLCKRLQLLGAFSNGNRNSMNHLLGGEVNLDNIHTLKAFQKSVCKMYDHPHVSEKSHCILKEIEKASEAKTCFNKMMCMNVYAQDYYMNMVTHMLDENKHLNGDKNMSIRDVYSMHTKLVSEKNVCEGITHYKYEILQKGVTYSNIIKMHHEVYHSKGEFRMIRNVLHYVVKSLSGAYAVYSPLSSTPYTMNGEMNSWSRNTETGMNVMRVWEDYRMKYSTKKIHFLYGDILSVFHTLKEVCTVIKMRRLKNENGVDMIGVIMHPREMHEFTNKVSLL